MASAADTEVIVRRRHPAVSIAKWAGISLLVILLLLGAFAAWLNTDPGRRFIVRQINNFEMASGLQVHIERIEGSVFGEMTLHGLALSDPEGVFFRAPVAELDYRPFAYLQNHIDLRSLVIPQARLHRLPELRPADPDAPLLPDIEIDVGRLAIARLHVDPAVTGRRHLLAVDSRIKIADGRALTDLNVDAVAAPGLPGGDRLRLHLDAVPERNRLDFAMSVRGPADGFVAGLIGVDRPGIGSSTAFQYPNVLAFADVARRRRIPVDYPAELLAGGQPGSARPEDRKALEILSTPEPVTAVERAAPTEERDA